MNLETARYHFDTLPLALCLKQKSIELSLPGRDVTLSIPRDQWPALRDFIDRVLTLHTTPQSEPSSEPSSELKPFNREAALAGAPVRTRDGRRVIAVAENPDTNLTASYPLLAWIEGDECLYTFTNEGMFYSLSDGAQDDLFME